MRVEIVDSQEIPHSINNVTQNGIRLINVTRMCTFS
jgi:hypothetical protein